MSYWHLHCCTHWQRENYKSLLFLGQVTVALCYSSVHNVQFTFLPCWLLVKLLIEVILP